MFSTAKQIPQTDIIFDSSTAHGDMQQLLLHIKRYNKLPLLNCEIFFSDDIWDFTANKKVNVSDTKFRVIFRKAPDCYLDIVKFYAFMELSRGLLKVQTISENIKIIARFLNYQHLRGYTAIEDITMTSIEEYFQQYKSTNAFVRNQSVIHKFFVDYSSIISSCDLDPEILSFLQHKEHLSALRAEKEAAKLPDIPRTFFNKLLDVTLRVIKSNDPEDKRFHHIANMLLLLMQTGLRIGELCALTINCMRVINFNGKRLVSIEYTTWKRERGTNVSSKVTTFANEFAEFAINNLIEGLKEVREKAGTDYLFVDPYKHRAYPISGEEFAGSDLKKYYLYISKYMETIVTDNNIFPELHRTKVTSFMGPQKKYKGVSIMHPVTEQYRVHVCTELYLRNVSLEYIAKYMGHLSAYMKGYYVRLKKQEQEDVLFSRSVLTKILSGDIEPLGGKGSLLQKIDEFIEANHFNISTDTERIVDELLKKVPIRQKSGGVCIKSSMLRDCSVDAETNEFYCAFNVCPNIYHFFYMADYTYQQANDLSKSIAINTEHGFLCQAEKERNMLYTLTKQKLIPELESLQKYINRDGVDAIVSQYPNLAYIAGNLDFVYREAIEWTKSK